MYTFFDSRIHVVFTKRYIHQQDYLWVSSKSSARYNIVSGGITLPTS